MIDKWYKPYLGIDPELFVKDKKGNIVGGEIVVEKEVKIVYSESKITLDGIALELNPEAQMCRQSMNSKISHLLDTLKHLVAKKDLLFDFNVTNPIREEEMEVVSKQNRQFGCKPTYNAQETFKSKIRDASKYLFRSGGGHIHVGKFSAIQEAFTDKKETDKLIKLMDIIVGNTFVLIDRDKGNIERRKNYGRAGEFRISPSKVEYRVLSNYWLRSPYLASFATGLVREAVIVYANGNTDEFLNAVDMEDIKNAINNNDFDLAMENFNRIIDLLVFHPEMHNNIPLMSSDKDNFLEFVADNIKKDKFPVKTEKDVRKILREWTGTSDPYHKGWENFLRMKEWKKIRTTPHITDTINLNFY